MDEYLIEFDDYKNHTLDEFIKCLKDVNGKKLNDLKVMDLTYYNSNVIDPGHGIYIFKEDKKIILVGKARTVSFTERIAKHFDLRPKAWFNRLMFVKCKEILGDNFSNTLDRSQTFKEASLYAFENYSLILVNMKNPDKIDRFETLLRGTAEPLNEFKTKKFSMDILLKDI